MKTHLHIQQLLKVSGLIFLFGMSCGMLRAQNPLVKQWDNRFGGTNDDYFSSFTQTLDGGYVLGGYSYSGIGGNKSQPNWNSNNTTFDYWIVKIDSSGNKQWDKRFGGIDDEFLFGLQQTLDGGFILGGQSQSAISGDKTQDSRGSYDYWILKIDSAGSKQWDKRFGGNKEDLFSTILQTKDGGYFLGGTSNSDSIGDKSEPDWDVSGAAFDYWVLKMDSLGNKQWDKRYGGTGHEELNAAIQTNDDGYLLGGFSWSDSSGNKSQMTKGYYDYWIVKIDSLGNIQWDKDFGGNNDDVLNSLDQTNDGGYILGGTSFSGIGGDKTQSLWGGSDYWIVKTDSIGNKQWDKDFGGTFGEDELGNISKTLDGGYLIAGTSYSPISGDKSENNLGNEQTWILKTDSSGNKQWDKTLRTNSGLIDDEHGCAIQTKNGGYACVNFTNSGIGGDKTQSGQGLYDYWIIKFYDSTQVNIPSVNISSTDTTFCEKHCIDFYDLSTNNPTSWQWFFPGGDSLTSTLQNPTNICYNNYGSFDVTLIACNAAGCDTLVLPGFINEYQTPTPTITQSNDTLFSSPGVAYQWWSVNSGIIAGATNYYYIPTQGGSYYVIVTDTNGCPGASNTIIITGIKPSSIVNGQWSIAPNPNDGSFTITLTSSITKDFSLRITNPIGQTISKRQEAKDTGQNSIDINMNGAAKGLYMVEVINGGKVYRGKFMVR